MPEIMQPGEGYQDKTQDTIKQDINKEISFLSDNEKRNNKAIIQAGIHICKKYMDDMSKHIPAKIVLNPLEEQYTKLKRDLQKIQIDNEIVVNQKQIDNLADTINQAEDKIQKLIQGCRKIEKRTKNKETSYSKYLDKDLVAESETSLIECDEIYTDPLIMLRFLDETYENTLYKKSYKVLFSKIMSENTIMSVIKNIDTYKNKEILIDVITSIKKSILFNNYNELVELGLPFLHINEEELAQLCAKDTEFTIYKYEKYDKAKNAKTLLKNAYKKKPYAVFSNYDKYNKILSTEDIDELLVEAAPHVEERFILEKYKYFYKNANAKNIIIKAGSKSFVEYLKHFDEYKGLPNAQEIFDEICKNNLSDTLYFMRTVPSKKIKEKEWQHSIVKLVEQYAPQTKMILETMQKQVKSITIGKQVIRLDGQVNIYSGLLKTYLAHQKRYIDEEGGISWKKVKEVYEKNLNDYISEGKKYLSKNKENTITFMHRAVAKTKGGTDNGAFEKTTTMIKKTYEKFSQLHYNEQIDAKPSEIIDSFKKLVAQDPNKQYIFFLGGHGREDGTMALKGGERRKSDFDELFNMQMENPNNIKIEIDSCFSGYKDDNIHDNLIKNIVLTSSKQTAVASLDYFFSKAFTKKKLRGKKLADFDGDGEVNYHEAQIFSMLHYNRSIMPTTFSNKNNEVIDIADITTDNDKSKDIDNIG